eukprot:comp20099_c0_seq1/m.24777 comp20099_c0_seq1/g.24777  ORF comp20099_c0_seq1/g.24777 comp20099_c0_seq1/m.24777 type:complete len:110 (-) comp20099_c0_seq1:236-565(-)
MADATALRNVKIKTGVVKRVTTEVSMYRQEVLDVEARIKRLGEEGKDPYYLKKQDEVLGEAKQMVPDTLRRLEAAVQALRDILDGDAELEGTEEEAAARQALVDAEAVM